MLSLGVALLLVFYQLIISNANFEHQIQLEYAKTIITNQGYDG